MAVSFKQVQEKHKVNYAGLWHYVLFKKGLFFCHLSHRKTHCDDAGTDGWTRKLVNPAGI